MSEAQKTPEQIAAEAAAAAKVKAAEKAAAAEAKAAKKAEEKAAAEAAAAAKKLEKANAAAAAKAAAAAAKQAKADEKAKAAADKAAEKAAKAAVKQPEQNGIVRPKPGTMCGKAWAIMDQLSAKLGSPTPVAPVLEIAELEGLNVGNVKCEYSRWRKFHGVTGRIVTPKPVEAAAETAATGTAE